MPNHYIDRWEGPIGGLRLPVRAWNSLQNEGINSLDQLRAAAYQLERFDGIGPKTAQAIREELARVVASKEQP